MADQGAKDVSQPESHNFKNVDGHNIVCRYWYPEKTEEPISVAVFILHGVGEHIRAYDEIAEALTQRGLLVCGHDHVGHGLSEGDRVHITDVGKYCKDAVEHVRIVKDRHPNITTCFLIGHSMGGTIAIKTALDNPTMFAGVVLIAPAIMPDKKTATPFKMMVAKAVAGVLPQMHVGPIVPVWVSRDPDVVKAYVEDPLNYHGGLKAKWAVVMLHTMEEIISRLEEIEWPFFLLHGTHDKLCLLEGSQLMYQKAPSKDKLLKVFPGAYHQIHNEPDGQGPEAINDIVDWITRV